MRQAILRRTGLRQTGVRLLGWLLFVTGVPITSPCFADELPQNAAATTTASTAPAAAVAANALNFEDDIIPILQARCFKCHGDEMRKASLDLRRRFTILKGGDGGPAIVPGKPEESTLFEMIEKREMPPKEEDPLDKKQIEVLRRWIAAGAPIKGQTEAPLEVTDAEETVSPEDRKFWAFQPPVRPVVPTVKGADRVRTPIDAFLLAKLEEKGIGFNPDAEPLTLLRRIYFDLIGLPPSSAQVDAYLADDKPGAYERLVDGLLASPQYGERWARHWLDVAGYADSDGYLEADRPRPEAWRYRDYVIAALNTDKPYDQFIREQIAGDELSDWRRAEELTPEMTEQLTATGFLRTASDPTYGAYRDKPECYKVMADTMQIISSAFLGLTLQCARCHSHKSEPISQRDYYQMHAVFLASYDPDRWVVSLERAIPLATEGQQAKVAAHNGAVTARVAALNAEQTELLTKHRDKYLNLKLAGVPADLRDKVKAAVLVAADKRNDEQKQLVAAHAANVVADEPSLFAHFPELKVEIDKLKQAVAAETALVRNVVQLRSLADMDDKPTPAHVLRRGDMNNKGKMIEPSVPAVLAPADYKFQPQPGYKSTGRRKAFAEWLIDPRQPTTARVHMNRLWAHHFGRGIMETVDDFGHTGRFPSHPELLDWLATEFVARGWSQKAMHKLMVMSTAYQQSSAHDAAKSAADPENVLLWSKPPQRHAGEVLRDSMLALAGKLNPQMFGPPVPVARQGDSSVITADNAQGNRRSIYVVVRRSEQLTLLEAFDTPRMEINCPRRTEAIVATQSLTLLNSPFVGVQAVAFAERVVQASADNQARIDFAFKQALTRNPSATERKSIGDFLESFLKLQLGEKLTTAAPDERLTAERAAWSHVAQMLFNTNEFVYVD